MSDGRLFLLVCLLICIVRILLPPGKRGIEETDTMTGGEFERWCADLLRRNGFHSVRVSGRSGDQGVDITARRNRKLYAVQCKRYSRPLGNRPVQEINTGMEMIEADVGIVMTNTTFTRGAREAAKLAGRDRPILLWGRMELSRMCGGGKRRRR